MKISKIKKRSGRTVAFRKTKITNAIYKAMKDIGEKDKSLADTLSDKVCECLSYNKDESYVPSIEEVQDCVENVIVKEGMTALAKSYILYRDKRAKMRESAKVLKRNNKRDSTDMHLLVEGVSIDDIVDWDKNKISQALVREAGLDSNLADEIASAVERKVINAQIDKVSTSLLRELVDNELFERGLAVTLEKQSVIGMPKYDLEQLIFSKSNENSNVSSNNPEAINLTIAENTLKQYALSSIFSKDIAEAHKKALIHLHDLGYPTRVYCSGHSLEYLKKYGVNIGNLDTKSGPAKHARTLTGHLNTFLASMQAFYAGALGVADVNVMYAPYVEHMSDDEMLQEAQNLIFSLAQSAFSRGGQSLVPEELVWVRDRKGLQQVKIGDLVDRELSKDQDIELRDDGTALTRNNSDDLKAIAFDSEGRVSDVKITAFARIPYSGDIYYLDTSRGPIKGLSPEHSVFVWDGTNFVPKAVRDLKKNDYLVSLKSSLNNESVTEIDLVDMYMGTSDADNRIRVLDEEGKFKEALKSKYGVGFYAGFESETGVAAECVRSNWLRSNKIPLKYYVEFVGRPDKLVYMGDSQSVISSKIQLTDSFLTILGLFITEGHNNSKRPTFISIANKNDDIINEIGACLDSLNCTYSKHINPITGVTDTAVNGLLAKVISDIAEDSDGVKQIPSFVYDMSLDKKQLFLDAIYKGDGSLNRGCYAVSSTSESIISGIGMLLSQLGKNFCIFKTERDNPNWKTLYEIREADHENAVIPHNYSQYKCRRRIKNIRQDMLNNGKLNSDEMSKLNDIINSDICFSRIRSIDKRQYKGFIYDISVPPTESFAGGVGSVFFHNTLFADTNITCMIPSYLQDIPAIGPGGEYTGRNYGDYAIPAARFAKAMLSVWKNGDSNGKLFSFPKCDLHYNDKILKDPTALDVFEYACEVASENGSVYFVFDRDEVTMAACCRLRTKMEDDYMLKHPESMRFCGFQNVTINLPQCAYRSGEKNYQKLVSIIDETMELGMKAHLQKREFIKSLMISPELPLWEIGKPAADGRPYVDLDISTYIIGLIGLNECVHYLVGQELHESDEAVEAGLKIITYMYYKAKELGQRYGLKVTLEESPAESAARRFAKVDMKNYPESTPFLRGDASIGDVYYTNSVHLRPDAPTDLLTRIRTQSLFHGVIESGAIIHAFVGETKPSAGAIKSLVMKTFEKTQAAQLTISPEFTSCSNCNKFFTGLLDECPHCKAKNIDGEYIRNQSIDNLNTSLEYLEKRVDER